MYNKSRFVFWVTLVLYGITLCTVSSTGVYLTYVAIPIIAISGLIIIITKPKEFSERCGEIVRVVSEFFNDLSSGIDSMNKSLEMYSEKTDLINKKTEFLRKKRNKLKSEKIMPKIELKYAKNQYEISESNRILKCIDEKINEVDFEIDKIKKQCELEIKKNHL